MSDDYSFVVAFVVYLFNMDIYLYISMYFQAEYRRFGVFNIFCVHYCTYYILFCCDVWFSFGCGWPRGFISFRQSAYISFIIKAFIVFYYYHPLTAYIGYLHLPRSRFYKGGFLP